MGVRNYEKDPLVPPATASAATCGATFAFAVAFAFAVTLAFARSLARSLAFARAFCFSFTLTLALAFRRSILSQERGCRSGQRDNAGAHEKVLKETAT
jgi:formate/nitrite transporter FocA (FNT family)